MKRRRFEAGFTLIEMLVVVSIIAIMISLTVPAINSMVQSQRQTSAKNLIRSALAQAQAYAVKERKYAGLRFQFDADGWETGKQYIVLIEKVPGVYTNEYRAVENVKPTALPEGMGFISGAVDLWPFNERNDYLDDDETSTYGWPFTLNGATTFSIIFSPSGQLVTKEVEIHERNINDTTFGTESDASLQPPIVLLSFDIYWDINTEDYSIGSPWCQSEDSATSFYIFEKSKMADVPAEERYTQYLSSIRPEFISIYTGKLIEEE